MQLAEETAMGYHYTDPTLCVDDEEQMWLTMIIHDLRSKK